MTWKKVEWCCGHKGAIQLRGPRTQKEAILAYEAGRTCLACWLVKKWKEEGDPRAVIEDRYKLAAQITASMGIRIDVTKEVQKRHYGNVKAKLPYFLKTIFQLDDVFIFIDPKADSIADYKSFFKIARHT